MLPETLTPFQKLLLLKMMFPNAELTITMNDGSKHKTVAGYLSVTLGVNGNPSFTEITTQTPVIRLLEKDIINVGTNIY